MATGIRVLGEDRDQGVPGFVDGDGVLLVGKQGVRGVPAAEKNPVARLVEVLGGHRVPVFPDRHDRRLVEQVREVRPREPGRAPGHDLEIHVGSELLLPWHGRPGSPLARARFGSGISTCRSKRPGRSRAGSSVSGRFVAAITTTPAEESKPSISASNWLRVCSRSSLETTAPPRAPADGIDLVDEDDGGRPLSSLANRSRTRDAPTPTKISTKLDPVTREERDAGLARHGPGHQRLARPRRADHEDALGPMAPALEYRPGFFRKSTTSATSRLAPS